MDNEEILLTEEEIISDDLTEETLPTEEEETQEEIQPHEPVLTQEELDLILLELEIQTDNLLLLETMSQHLELLNLKIVGELDDFGEIQATPDEETTVYNIRETNNLIDAQTTILSQLLDNSIAEEQYRVDSSSETVGYLSEITDSLNTLIELQEETADVNSLASSSILTYSTVYIPLAVIIMSLWWFFKNFLNRIR